MNMMLASSYIDMDQEVVLMKELEALRERHRYLDDQLKTMGGNGVDQLAMVRMKKEKLALRDKIAELEEVIYPDLIA